MTVTNQIQEFAANATPENIMTLEAYAASPKRLSGHVPGLGDQTLENAVLRQVSRLCRGLAEFIARHYSQGVVDDGDVEKVVEGMTVAILAVLQENVTISAASETVAGIIKLATVPETILGTDTERACTPADIAAVLGVKVRTKLTAALTLHVSTTGSDTTGTGAVDKPFATPQGAWDYAMCNLDLAGFGLTIQLADGTYAAGLIAAGKITGQAGFVTVQGNATTPANVHVGLSGNGFQVSNGAFVDIRNLKITASSTAIYVAYGAPRVSFTNIVFGACSNHIVVLEGGECTAGGNYSIVGGASGAHWSVGPGGILRVESRTITLTGTPAFGYFAYAHNVGKIYCPANVFSGSATGMRYYCVINAVINTSGGGANYLPGSVAGSYATGGQYV